MQSKQAGVWGGGIALSPEIFLDFEPENGDF